MLFFTKITHYCLLIVVTITNFLITAQAMQSREPVDDTSKVSCVLVYGSPQWINGPQYLQAIEQVVADRSLKSQKAGLTIVRQNIPVNIERVTKFMVEQAREGFIGIEAFKNCFLENAQAIIQDAVALADTMQKKTHEAETVHIVTFGVGRLVVALASQIVAIRKAIPEAYQKACHNVNSVRNFLVQAVAGSNHVVSLVNDLHVMHNAFTRTGYEESIDVTTYGTLQALSVLVHANEYMKKHDSDVREMIARKNIQPQQIMKLAVDRAVEANPEHTVFFERVSGLLADVIGQDISFGHASMMVHEFGISILPTMPFNVDSGIVKRVYNLPEDEKVEAGCWGWCDPKVQVLAKHATKVAIHEALKLVLSGTQEKQNKE